MLRPLSYIRGFAPKLIYGLKASVMPGKVEKRKRRIPIPLQCPCSANHPNNKLISAHSGEGMKALASAGAAGAVRKQEMYHIAT